MPSDLDFISRPNPVEPSALNNGNPSAHQLDRSTNEQLMPFLLNGRSSQQRRDAPSEINKPPRQYNQLHGLPIADVLNKDVDTELTPPRPDQAVYTLPKLVPVKRVTKRHRVPPVLQGLHEPPPTSRILPSISTEETQVLLPSTRSHATLNDASIPEKETILGSNGETVALGSKQIESQSSDKRTVQRNKWTDQETEDLLRGVAQFGIGSWKKILLCPNYNFNKRTAVDLKDRFRVCKPNAYGKPRTKKAQKALETKDAKAAAEARSPMDDDMANGTTDAAVVPNSHLEDSAETENDSALWKVKRRKRRKFTDEEDEALLRGYEEYGASWHSIQKDPVFQTTGRRPTDLRDRFRTRFPDQYAKSGLVPRPVNFPKPLPRSGAASEDQPETTTPTTAPVSEVGNPSRVESSWHRPNVPSMAHRPHVLPLPRFTDEFLPGFGLNDDDDDGDGPIVLDRSIVDWANSNMPSSRPIQHSEAGAFGLPGIDPLITLKLPKPGQF